MEPDEHSRERKEIIFEWKLVEYFTISSSRFRAVSSRSALTILGSRSPSVFNERCQRFFGKYQAPYRYFCGGVSRSKNAEGISLFLALPGAIR